MIRIEKLSSSYNENIHQLILNELDLKIKHNSCIGLIGENGSGKTTLAHSLIGIIPNITRGNVSGSFYIDKKNLLDQSIDDRLKYVAYTFQDVESQILFGNVSDVIGLSEKNVASMFIKESLNILKINHLLNRNPHELSGGEAQRVALVSAFRMNPKFIIYDEATSALDPIMKRDFINLVKYLLNLKKSVLLMGQRLEMLLPYTTENFELTKGKVSHNMNLLVGGEKKYLKELEFWEEIFNLSLLNQEYAPEIEINNLKFNRKKGTGFQLLINDLKILSGERIAILGENGSGKTTLFYLLNGILRADKSLVRVNNSVYRTLKKSKLSNLIEFVYHSPTSQIIGSTIEEEIFKFQEIFPNILGILSKQFKFLIPQKDPLNLSFGQQRFLCMLSAILSKRPIIIFDEPEYGLDYNHLNYVESFFQKNKRAKTIIFSTHDIEFAAQFADRCLLMKNGRIVSEIKSSKSDTIKNWFFKNSAS